MIERKEEISATLTLIQTMCVTTNITLFAKEHKGQLMVAVRDEVAGKEYALMRGNREVQE